MIRRLAMAGLAGFALLPAFTPAPAYAAGGDCTECQWSEVFESMWCSPLVIVGETNCQWWWGGEACVAWDPEPCFNTSLSGDFSSMFAVARKSPLHSPGQTVGMCSVRGQAFSFSQMVAMLVES